MMEFGKKRSGPETEKDLDRSSFFFEDRIEERIMTDNYSLRIAELISNGIKFVEPTTVKSSFCNNSNKSMRLPDKQVKKGLSSGSSE